MPLPPYLPFSPKSRLSALLSGVALAGLSLLIVVPAATAEDVRTGVAAFGDWTGDAPGVRRLIRPRDLPAPYATQPVANGPSIVPRPRGAAPAVPPGFSVSVLLDGLHQPRQMRTAPNGDVFLAESGAGRIRVIRAGAGAEEAKPEAVIFAADLARPYGLAFYPPGPKPEYLYVATQAEILRFPYRVGDTQAIAQPQRIAKLPGGEGHWTRDVAFSADGKTMFVSVGSGSNDAEGGMADEARRADILTFDPNGADEKIFASGIRNPVTLAFDPQSGQLWTSVNERDGLGDNLPPDYVTHVAQGGFYGWPWFYIGNHPDPRHQGEHAELADKVLVPDMLLQPHSAPLGLAFYTGTQFPAVYRGDIFVALHGSWNREKRTGYKLIRIHMQNGKPVGGYEDFMTGFVTANGDVWGRPVGVDVAADGSLLMSDDASGTIWRITYNGS